MPARKGQKYKPRTKDPIFNEILTCALCPAIFNKRHSQHKYCDECSRKAALAGMKRWHDENREKHLEYSAHYYKKYYEENRDKIIERTTAYRKTERGKEAHRIAGLNQKLHNAKKIAARQIVKIALVGGHLTKKPCEMCGALKVQAHHEDYDKPLEVIWLCVTDHHRLHRERRDEEKVK